MQVNLEGQSLEKATIEPSILKLKQLMNQRLDIWKKLSIEDKKAWAAKTAIEDPIMNLSLDLYNYLHKNFFDESIE